MISYILETTLCWTAFYGLYGLFLSRSTYFRHNRAYLLGSLLLGLILPAIDWAGTFYSQPAALVSVTLQPIVVGIDAVEIAVTATATDPGWSIWKIVKLLYWTGVAFAAFRFLSGIWNLARLYRKSESRVYEGYTLVQTDSWHTPFSFFNYLFWSRQMDYSSADKHRVMLHEQAHMQGWHSLDVLLLELLGILFWPSPLVYLYSRSLRAVHEYLADEAVLRYSQKKKQYGHLLLRQSQSGQPIALANHFINSQLKKRILMMTKTKSKRQVLIRYFLILPMLLGLVLAFAKASSDPKTGPGTLEATVETAPQGDVDKMPIFAGCEELEGETEQAACTKKKLVEFMISKLKYPAEAEAAEVEGQVVVEFTIGEDGAVRDAQALKGIGYGCDEAALSVVRAMPNWTPALKDGKPVSMKMTLPFNFALPKQDKEEVFKVAEEMPRFPGCEASADANERTQCSKMELLQFIFDNIKYPADAKEAGVEGVCVVQFVVNTEGRIEGIKIVRELHPSIDAEVMRVAKKMNEMEEPWVPGRQKGKAVKVQFNIPVKFKMDENDKKPGLPNPSATLQLKSYRAAPNPTSGLLNLQFEAATAPTVIRLLDSNGREVLRESLNRFEGVYQQSLDMSKLSKGAYILHISQGEAVFTDKVILQ